MPYDPLDCRTIVFRAAIYKKWIKATSIAWQAFVRKEGDVTGVSLSMRPDYFEGLNNPIEGVISVHTGHLRDVSTEEHQLDVIQNGETHAEIRGLLCYHVLEGDERQSVEDAMKSVCMDIAEKAARKYPPDPAP
jgi:hypothetical protein